MWNKNDVLDERKDKSEEILLIMKSVSTGPVCDLVGGGKKGGKRGEGLSQVRFMTSKKGEEGGIPERSVNGEK